MKVYRVEDKDGIGPYNSEIAEWRNSVSKWRMRIAHSDDIHMAMFFYGEMDNLTSNEAATYYCAFSCMADLFAWFNGFEDDLDKFFKVMVFDAAEQNVIIPDKTNIQILCLNQIFIKRNESVLVNSMSFLDAMDFV